ncbi:MAG: DUF6263 family protein [Candidatus Pseudobacter hemicellulosilyticus]|uniref:DUF6263 family protein n=1 Tax=Candidatus Pseudobacter hemicellulosilyticus TaxID=3121375 RepID=A0AAJ5WT66_9BACT|nr:MAG: DUF6263 family protein [Pseudobacter sp.]
MAFRYTARWWAPFLLLFLLACGEQPVELRFDPPAGKPMNYLFSFVIQQQYMGQAVNSTMQMGLSLQQTGEERGEKILTASYHRFSLRMESGGAMVLELDTDQPNPTKAAIRENTALLQGRILHALLGQAFTMRVNQLGEISAVSGLDSIADRIAQVVVTDLDLPVSQLELVRSTASGQFNEESVKKTLQLSMNIYPGKPVKTGDQWERTVEVNQGYPLTVQTVFTVTGISKQGIILEGRSTLTGKMGDTHLEGTQTSQLELDPVSGLVKKGEIRQEVKGLQNNAPITITNTGSIILQ